MTNSVWYSRSLVAAQMILIVCILSPVAQLFRGSPLQLTLVALLLLFAVAFALWALTTMRLEHFSVMPEPTSRAELITTGPYRYIRHPMYSAVLIATAAGCIAHLNLSSFAFFLLLVAVLYLKIRREEHLLMTRFEQYSLYRTKTSALVPYIL